MFVLPLHMFVASVLFGLALLIYSWRVRPTMSSGRCSSPEISRMAAGPVNQVRILSDMGVKMMPLNLRTGHEGEKRR